MESQQFPMGKQFKCHLGFFELPSEIYGVEIGDDYLIFDCKDAFYRVDIKESRTVSMSKKEKNES